MSDPYTQRNEVNEAYNSGAIDYGTKVGLEGQIDSEAASERARMERINAARPDIPNETEGIFALIFWVIAAGFKLVWIAIRWSLPRLHKIFGFLVAVGSAALLWAGLMDPLRSLLEGIFGDSVATQPSQDGSPVVVAGAAAVVGLIATQVINVRYGNVRVAFREGNCSIHDLYGWMAALWTSIFIFTGLALTVWRIASGDDLGRNPDVDSALWMIPVGLLATAACVAVATWWFTRDARSDQGQATSGETQTA